MSVRVLLIDDHKMMREGLCSLLANVPDIEIVGEASDGRSALDLVRTLAPDVVVMDIGMADLNGVEATRRIRTEYERVKVIALSTHSDKSYVHHMLEAGACGYVLKTDPGSYLIKGVDALRRDQIFFTPSLAAIAPAVRLKKSAGPAKPAEPNSLTPRQREILQLLAEGKTSKQIGVALDLSIKTVETHRTHIMNRLNCHSISALVRYAIRNHVIEA